MEKNTIKVRAELVEAMHEYMTRVNDEDIYDYWVMMGVPDDPRDCDYETIAEDHEMFRETVALFAKLVKRCGDDLAGDIDRSDM